jgi:hypothetical protein
MLIGTHDSVGYMIKMKLAVSGTRCLYLGIISPPARIIPLIGRFSSHFHITDKAVLEPLKRSCETESIILEVEEVFFIRCVRRRQLTLLEDRRNSQRTSVELSFLQTEIKKCLMQLNVANVTEL